MAIQEDNDSYQHQACYIFSPGLERPNKKRRTNARRPRQHTIDDSDKVFPSLLNGQEERRYAELRHRIFKDMWSQQETAIADILKNLNAGTLGEVTTFITDSPLSRNSGKIPTGLINVGSSIASHQFFFDHLAKRVQADSGDIFVHIRSGESPNLKAVLRNLIKRATNQTDLFEDNQIQGVKGRKHLPYDLNILWDHVRKHRVPRVVIALQDSEAFDGGLLTELIMLLSLWLDRIPFLILFGIATSIEFLQEKLPHSALKHLEGVQFDVEQADETKEQIFNIFCGPKSNLRLGPNLSRMLLDRNRDMIQSVQSFTVALKYAYMSHLYANPLSFLSTVNKIPETLQMQHYEAMRNLPSFRKLVETELDLGHPREARDLLEHNEAVASTLPSSVSRCRQIALSVLDATEVIHTMSLVLSEKEPSPLSEIYTKAVAGDLRDSGIVRGLLLSLLKADSYTLSNLLHKTLSITLEGSGFKGRLLALQEELEQILRSQGEKKRVIRSEHDARHETMRTAVVGQKVELRKERPVVSKEEQTYSELVHRVRDMFKEFFDANLANPQHVFLHELFYYDLKSPHRDVFSPKPRFAIERALSNPRDYLNCDCCTGPGNGLSATQPATSILYQLYLECGALINVFDLWSAFYAIVGGEDGEDCDEGNAMALFYRGLADLQLMGMIKQSRKKPDHIAKLAWKGL